jgi:hypothetical protein
MPTAPLPPAPGRDVDARTLDQWNQAWRASPIYEQMYRLVGGTPGRPLSDDQRRNILAVLRSHYGMAIPSGMNIDPAGNLNQANLKAERLLKGAAIAGAAVGGAGALGLFGGGAPTATTAGTTAGTAGVIPGTGIPVVSGSAATLPGLVAPAAATTGTGGALGAISGFLGDNWRDLLGMAGPVLGAHSASQGNQRQAELAIALAEEDINQRRRTELWNQLLQREQEGRAGRSDAWKQLQTSEYVAGGGRPYKAADWMTTYGFGPTAPSANTQAGARTLSDRSQQYLKEGPTSLTPTAPTDPYRIDPSLARPGAWEQITGLVGTGLTGFGQWQQLERQRRQQQQQPPPGDQDDD